MAANVATLSLKIKISDDGTVKVLDNVSSASKKAGDQGVKSFTRMNTSAKSLTSTLVKAGAAIGGLYAVKKAGLAFLDAASDLEETQGKFDVVFRGMTETAETWSKTLVDAYAMSETESKKYLSSIQDLLVPTGMLREDAGKLSNQFVKMAADLGSFNNRETSAVIMDIQSALQGGSETMAKYGINVKAAKVEQEILRSGMAATKDEITDAHKAQAIYNIMMRDGADAVGDMDRTSDSYANQLKKAEANVEDLETRMGEHLLPTANDVVSSFNNWIDANEDLLKQKIPEYVDDIKGSLLDLKSAYDAMPSEIVGPAGAGLVGRIIFGSWKAASVAGAIKVIYDGMEALYDLAGRDVQGSSWKEYVESINTIQEILSGQRDWNTGELIDVDGNIQKLQALETRLDDLKSQGNWFFPADPDEIKAVELEIDNLNWKIRSLGQESEKVDFFSDMPMRLNTFADDYNDYLDEIVTIGQEAAAEIKKAQGDALLQPKIAKPADIGNVITPEMLDAADKWIEKTRTHTETLKQQVAELKNLYDAGLLGKTAAENEENYIRALGKAGADAQEEITRSNKDSADKVEGIWENTRDTIQNSLTGFLSDSIKGDLDTAEDYFTGFADTLADIWSVRVIEEIMENGLANGLQNALSGDMLGIGAATGILQVGANLLFGDDGPSHFEILSDAINDLIDSLQENTQALKDQLYDISTFTTAVRDAKKSILYDDLPGMDASLTDELNLPGGMKQRRKKWYEKGVFEYAAQAMNFVPGVGYLASEIAEKDKGYTAYSMGNEQLEQTMITLFEKLNLAELFDLFKQSSTDAGALMDALVQNNLLNPEIPQRVIDWFSDSGGSANIKKVSEGISAILEEAVLNVLNSAKQLAGDITGYITDYDDTKLTEYERKLKDINAVIDDFKAQSAEAIPVLETMLASQNIDADAKEKAAEQLNTLISAQEDYVRILSETEQTYADHRATLLDSMAADLSAYTGPLSDVEKAIAAVADQGENYRDELIDNGMAIADATEKTAEWTAAMSEFVQQEMVNNTTRSLTIELLRAQGNEEAALGLERENEINSLRATFGSLSGPLEMIKQKIWDIEDAARALSAVDVSRSAYYSAVQTQLTTAQGKQAALETTYADAKNAYISALQGKIAEEQAANQARIDTNNRAASSVSNLVSETQNMADTFASLVDTISDYRSNLIADDAFINIQSRYKSAQNELNAAISGMYSSESDVAAASIGKIPELSRTFLDISKSMGGDYRADLARVMTILNTAEGIAGIEKSAAERQLASAKAREASLSRISSSVAQQTSQYQTMLDQVEADQADTRSFEEIQKAYLDAKTALDESTFNTEIDYWQAELDRLDLLINSNLSLETAFDNYATALTSAIAGGYDDVSGKFAAELAALKAMPETAPAAKASFAGGGTITGPVGGYTVATTFHGTEHITPDSQMAEVRDVLSEVRDVLVQIRDTNGVQNKYAQKLYRKIDQITGGENSLQTRAA